MAEDGTAGPRTAGSAMSGSPPGKTATHCCNKSAWTDAQKKAIDQAIKDQKAVLEARKAELERWNEADKKNSRAASAATTTRQRTRSRPGSTRCWN